MPGATAAVSLPSGVWHGGSYYRHVSVRGLRGEDELAWLELPEQLSLPERVSALLEATVDGIPAALIAALTVGDREALLLHLRRLSFGERIEAVLRCSACGEQLDLDLLTSDLLLPPYEHPRPRYEAELGDGCRVCFRLPTGADQAEIAGLGRVDLQAAEQSLVDQCVESVTCDEGPLERLPESLNAALADRMAQLDPQAELNLAMTCPACAASFDTVLDMGQFMAAEVANRSRLLDREIHLLALYYHWSEADILRLPVQRRKTYLRLLDESFEGVA